MREVEFLGVVIGLKGIKMEKEKVKGVLEWPMPKCVKDIQKFLGLANYYHRFIEGFATVARPLHDLVKKDKRWEWTEREEKVFKELKERLELRCDKVGTIDGKLPPSAISSYIDSSGAIDIHAKTCRK